MIEAGTDTSSSPPAAISGTPTVTFSICPDDLETDEDYDGSDVGSPREGRLQKIYVDKIVLHTLAQKFLPTNTLVLVLTFLNSSV